jgi:hypothetical protein
MAVPSAVRCHRRLPAEEPSAAEDLRISAAGLRGVREGQWLATEKNEKNEKKRRRAAVAELAPSLVGSWRLVSYETKRADGAAGSASHPFGDAPIGLFIFDPDGNYSVQLSNPADSGSWVGSWGRYEVDEAEVMFILEPTAGTAQLPPGTKTTRRVTLNGNGTATFRPPVQVVDGVDIQGYITWRKVSGAGPV